DRVGGAFSWRRRQHQWNLERFEQPARRRERCRLVIQCRSFDNESGATVSEARTVWPSRLSSAGEPSLVRTITARRLFSNWIADSGVGEEADISIVTGSPLCAVRLTRLASRRKRFRLARFPCNGNTVPPRMTAHAGLRSASRSASSRSGDGRWGTEG